MPAVPLKPGRAPDLEGWGGKLTGGGDTDWTLWAAHIAGGSNSAVPRRTCRRDSDGELITGPITSELVGMAAGGTATWRGRGTGAKAPGGCGRTVTRRQGLQAEGRLDQSQARTVLERPCMYQPARAHQVGHDDGGDPEPELFVIRDELPVGRGGAIACVHDIGRVGLVNDHGWWYVVVKAAPFVKSYDQHGAVQVAVVGHCVVGVSDKALTQPNVRERVVVTGRPRPAAVEGRVDEADVWQRPRRTGVDERSAAGKCGRVPIGKGVEERLVLERGPRLDGRVGPQGQEGDVPVVIAAGRDVGSIGDGGELVPDGREGRRRFGVVVPVGLSGVLVKAGPGGFYAGEGAEIAVQRHVLLGQRADDG